MRINRRLLISTMMILAASNSWGGVNVTNGSFYYNLELRDGSKDRAIILHAMYDHQKTQVGLFGLGWCSDIEDRLEIVSAAEVRYLSCGSGQAKVFHRDSKRAGATAEFRPEDLKVASDFPKISSSREQFKLALSRREVLTFDSRGRLIARDRDGQNVLINREASWISLQNSARHEVARLTLNSKNLITEVRRGAQTQALIYDQNILTAVGKGSFLNEVSFAHDDQGRTKEVSDNSGVTKITYGLGVDVVAKITDSSCSSQLVYTVRAAAAGSKSPAGYDLAIAKTCGLVKSQRQLTFRTERELFIQEEKNGDGVVTHREIKDASTFETLFVVEANRFRKFDSLGQVIAEGTPSLISEFDYDTTGKIKRVTRVTGTGRESFETHYNPSGRLDQLRSPAGEIVFKDPSRIQFETGVARRNDPSLTGKWTYSVRAKPYLPGKTTISFNEARMIMNLKKAVSIATDIQRIESL